jgi:hypothetical protein
MIPYKVAILKACYEFRAVIFGEGTLSVEWP